MNTFNYKLDIEYDGSHFFGWQIQKSTKETIQGYLNQCLSEISKDENIKTIASGRTDAGVHARSQIVKATIPLEINSTALKRGLNSLLPGNIKVREAETCEEDFHPIFQAKSKEYRYFFSRNESPFIRNMFTHMKYDLNLEKMNEGAKLFLGEHDFLNYFCEGTDVKTTVREIYSIEIEKINEKGFLSPFLDDYYVLKIEGNGFLKQMVRLIMGALFSLGKEKITLSDIKKSFDQKLQDKLGPVAPPEGLYLWNVKY